MIESYLKSHVDSETNENTKEIIICPFVKSMKTGVSIPTNVEYKKEHRDYISEKYR